MVLRAPGRPSRCSLKTRIRMSIEEVIEQFPVTREQIDSLMAFVRAPSKGPGIRIAEARMLTFSITRSTRSCAIPRWPFRGGSPIARWEEISNGELIDAAERAGFEVMVTTDKNIRYQQNLKGRKIALVVLEHSQ